MTDDWNPYNDDEDATRVHYDLGRWTFDQQAELASELAEAEVPHVWEGIELLVPEEYEAAADAAIAAVELRLNIIDAGDIGANAIDLDDGTPATEYDLADWSDVDRANITQSLVSGSVAHRWEGDGKATLVVASDDELVVDELLDLIERGEITASDIDDNDHSDDDSSHEIALEALTGLFLASERLQRNAANPEGFDSLVDALGAASPKHPPYGVERRLWERALELGGGLLAELENTESDDDAAQEMAVDLHDLLRPYV